MTDTETKTLIAIKDSTQEMGYVQMIVTENEINAFFKYNCKPRGYILEGERTIGNQSEQSATLCT